MLNVNLKAQVLEIAKSKNLLGSENSACETNAFKEAEHAWQLIKNEPLILLKDFYPDCDCQDINFELINDVSFGYEISAVMSLHTVHTQNPSKLNEKEQTINNAKLTFQLQKVLPLPTKLNRLVAKIMSLGMHAQISAQNSTFVEYLSLLLPVLSPIKATKANALAALIDDKKSTDIESGTTNSQSASRSQEAVTSHSQAHSKEQEYLLEQGISYKQDSISPFSYHQELLLLEFLPIVEAIFNKDASTLLNMLEDYKKLLLSSSQNLKLSLSNKETESFILFSLFINKLIAATKVLALRAMDHYHEPSPAANNIEQHLKTALDLATKLNMHELDIIARSLRSIVLLKLPVEDQGTKSER